MYNETEYLFTDQKKCTLEKTNNLNIILLSLKFSITSIDIYDDMFKDRNNGEQFNSKIFGYCIHRIEVLKKALDILINLLFLIIL